MAKVAKTTVAVKAQPANVPPPVKTAKRKIHFYDLIIDFLNEFNPTENEDKFMAFFSKIARLAATKNPLRYQPVFEAKVFMQDVTFKDDEKKIYGKLLYVKEDIFPELINLQTDITTDIEAAENDGIVETTHFIIDYSRKLKKIAIEYNHAGAKSADFKTYFELIGIEFKAIRKVVCKPIVRDELKNFKDRIALCSTMDVRIHKDNIDKIEGLDKKMGSLFRFLEKQYDSEYLEIKLRFSYKARSKPQKVKSSIDNVLTGLVEDKTQLDYFETFKVNALDRKNNFEMHVFDFLIDKVESDVYMQRKPKHKVLISVDVYDKLNQEMFKHKI